jgi:serine phosphatase RsbU (regulator of sigma subunit)
MLPDATLTVERKYQLLSDINQRLIGTLDLDQILEELLDSVATFITFDAGGIFVLNEDPTIAAGWQPRQFISSIVWRGYPSHPAPDDPMLTQGRGIIGQVIRSGMPLVAPDVRVDPYYVAGRELTLSEIAVPIRIGERTIGALNLESNALAAFSQSDAAVLGFFADAAALSIDKAILHRRLLDQERLKKQLRLARDVQARLLPAHSPTMPGYDIVGICVPAFEIGGDYYDFIDLAGDHLGLVVADVSGEGVPAAMIMTAFRALLRTHARQIDRPDAVANLLNHLLPEFTGQVDFVTAVYGVLQPETGSFTYVNCGHNPPFVLRWSGAVDFLPPAGPLLSIFNDPAYQAAEIALAPGDTLILYTDGIVELADEAYREYGLDRLQATALAHRSRPALELIDCLLADARQHAQRDLFSDDLTLLVARRL